MLNDVILGLNLKFKGVFMKNIIITSVAAIAVLAFAGCAPKKSCGTTPVAVKAPAPARVVVKAPTPSPVKKAPVVQAVEPVAVPVIDAKEAAVQ